MALVSFTRQGNHVRPCQDMALINYDKAKIPCKTMPRHDNGEFIRQGYHVRQCQDMEMVSLIRKVMDLERVGTVDLESNAPARVEGMVPPDSNDRPVTVSQGGGAREAFFQAMNEWFAEFICTNPAVRPPPPHDRQTTHVASLVTNTVRREKPPIDKIRKQRAEEFRATKDDDTENAEFWLENTIKVFDKLSYTPKECMKCVVPLL
ncbi:Histidine ammonia-lyase [Gossypium arboreum]|uniref:Histidine ammonia-lyase n=1 Tax=Gossypium arboreum TaxID=29729 RepID=A0A0B0N9K0_GOSAR|nr:Histidine ammonia-lyase [Gossypium arboreum]